MNAEQNYRLLQDIDANRRFLLQAYCDNPTLLARAEPEVRLLFCAAQNDMLDAKQTAVPPAPTFPRTVK
jgi:hypothetical protein